MLARTELLTWFRSHRVLLAAFPAIHQRVRASLGFAPGCRADALDNDEEDEEEKEDDDEDDDDLDDDDLIEDEPVTEEEEWDEDDFDDDFDDDFEEELEEEDEFALDEDAEGRTGEED
jgi:hypothetical protein